METVETSVLKSSFSGIKGAKKERKMLEKSPVSCLGPRGRWFETSHSDQSRGFDRKLEAAEGILRLLL